jgi:putative ABC transport system permease protein
MKKRIIKSGVKFLIRHKLQSFFMILGIAIGVVFLSLTFSLGLGTVEQITSKVKSSFGSNTVFIMAGKGMMMGGPRSEGPVTSLKIEDLEAVRDAVPGVVSFDPIQALPECEIIAGDRNIPTNVIGRSAEGELVWNRTVTSGEFISKEDEKSAARVALIGSRIKKQLFGDENPLGSQIRIGAVLFTVKGVLEEKGTDPHGNDLDMEVIVPITTLMSRLMNVDYVTGAKLEVDEARMAEIGEKISAVLRDRHSVISGKTDDFYVMSSVQIKNMIQKMSKIFSVYLPLISGVVLLLGGIIISILMLMSVSRRFGEIGLRKAVGASSKSLRFQFLTEAVLISFTGGITGLILGISGTWMIFSKMSLTFFIPWQTIVFGVMLPVIIGILAGMIPARKAADFDPVKALS